jgi:nucleoside 2-deoxyribosyltransferase
MKVYTAGPEVFLPNGLEIIERKNVLVRRYGFETARRPGEYWDRSGFEGVELGKEVSRRNELIMDGADLLIANLTPFRGVSADPGTVYELGYMVAQNKPAYAFTNDVRGYTERVTQDFYRGAIVPGPDGRPRGSDGHRIEDHHMVDNLMLDGTILRRGGRIIRHAAAPAVMFEDLTAFEQCLATARDDLANRTGPFAIAAATV